LIEQHFGEAGSEVEPAVDEDDAVVGSVGDALLVGDSAWGC
jgi:hypothetical protein